MTSSTVAAAPTVRTRPPAALVLLFALLVVALVARLVFTLVEPPYADGLSYDDLRAAGSSVWPLHLFLGGPGYLVSFVAIAIFLVVLSRERVLGLIGAVLVALGGTVFSLAIVAVILPYTYAADPALFDEARGRALVELGNGDPAGLAVPIVGAQATIGLGVIVGLVAVLLARTTPRWFPIGMIVYVLVTQTVPLPEALAVPEYVVQSILLGAVGWFALRSRAVTS